MKEFGKLKKKIMLERKTEKRFSARQKSILNECEKPSHRKEITHFELRSNTFSLCSGVYGYDSTRGVINDLDGNFVNIMSAVKLTKEGAIFHKHIPTWRIMIENGEVKDLRTKKNDDVVEASVALKGVKTPVRRSLS